MYHYNQAIVRNVEIYYTSSQEEGRRALEANEALIAEWEKLGDDISSGTIRSSKTLNALALFRLCREMGDRESTSAYLKRLQVLITKEWRDRMPRDAWDGDTLTEVGAYEYAVYVDELFRKSNPELNRESTRRKDGGSSSDR